MNDMIHFFVMLNNGDILRHYYDPKKETRGEIIAQWVKQGICTLNSLGNWSKSKDDFKEVVVPWTSVRYIME